MLRIMICLILAVGVLSAPPALNMIESNLDVISKITIVKDLDEARLLYPGAQFTQMERNENTKGAIRYTLGNRVNGDRVVAQGSDGKQWSSPQNVQLTIQYPSGGGNGAVVSFVDVVVDQSSNLGSGYVVGGGIGQRRIAVLIEGKNTLWFRWQAAIYGL